MGIAVAKDVISNHIKSLQIFTYGVMATRKTHREICSLCHEVSRVGFSVSNKIWELAVHRSQINDIICLRCFTRLADERGVEWDKDIKFYPVSQITNCEVVTNG